MQVVNNSDAFQAPTGTGAVIFDFPNVQPLDILLKANQDIDNWNRQKQLKAQQDRAERAKMFADIKFDTKGALAEDIQNTITPEANKTFELATKVFSLPQDSPEFMKGMVELKRQQANVDFLINESVNHKELFAEALKPLDPTKSDQEQTLEKSAAARILPLKPRIDFFRKNGSLIVPRTVSVDEIIQDGIKEAVAKPTTTGTDTENIHGHWVQKETTETVPYTKALELANGWTQNNYKGVKDKVYNVVEEWMQKGEDANGLPNDPNLRYYAEKAATTTGAKGERYTPAELYLADQIYKNNSLNIDTKPIGADFYQQESSKLAVQANSEAKQGGALVDLVSGVFQGKPQLFKPSKVTINGVEKDAVKTDALNAYKLGTFPVTEDGKFVGNADNMILETIRSSDGKILVKTTETYSKSLTDERFKKNPYIVFNNETELYNAIGGGLPEDKREKVLNGGREYAKKRGAYTDATSFDGAKIANVTPEERKKMDGMYGIRVETVPNPTNLAAPTKADLQKKTTPQPAKKQIKKTDISAKAKAAGYTVAEYTKLLTDKGVEIVN